MSVVINTNFAATVAANNLASSNAMLQKSLNRLSSGAKIVSPADDAGGLAVSMKLSAAATRSGAAAINIGNATSMLQTQDGVLKVAGKVLDRLGELWTLFQDPTKNASDLSNYDAEFTQLQKQLKSLGAETFNGKALFGSTSISVPVSENGSQLVTLTGKDFSSTSAGIGGLLNAGADLKAKLATEAATYAASGSTTDLATLSADIATLADTTAAATINTALSTYVSDTTGTATIDATVTAINAVNDSSAVTGAKVSLADLNLADITTAIQNVATMRANNGAEQSRLGFAGDVLTTNKANLEAANSRIMDVDVAEESTQLARWNVLVQSGTAMLSQANQSAQIALKLLG